MINNRITTPHKKSSLKVKKKKKKITHDDSTSKDNQWYATTTTNSRCRESERATTIDVLPATLFWFKKEHIFMSEGEDWLWYFLEQIRFPEWESDHCDEIQKFRREKEEPGKLP